MSEIIFYVMVLISMELIKGNHFYSSFGNIIWNLNVVIKSKVLFTGQLFCILLTGFIVPLIV